MWSFQSFSHSVRLFRPYFRGESFLTSSFPWILFAARGLQDQRQVTLSAISSSSSSSSSITSTSQGTPLRRGVVFIKVKMTWNHHPIYT